MDNEAKITTEEQQETKRRVSELIREMQTEAIKKFPLWMRLNYFANQMAGALEKGYKEDDFDWERINTMCATDLDQFDYNMYKPVQTVSEFESQRFDIICASEGVGPWHKHKCKDCGEEFYMNYTEVAFYQKKELNLPKRCKECREKRKKGL